MLISHVATNHPSLLRMEDGEEIVFADECGSWMIPGDEKTFVLAYVTSLATVETPEGFTVAALKAELKRQNIRTSARS